ncbi:MAG: hypothetical protein UW85_C0001G0003 [Parcubacteria group bacterium GW2011_GWA1_Parcubacteria_45_10]|nr:MAG: hypothetical protein UW85_C0001G0003 [Parcubacteria group bacterium GW2011_GWA1_Parcubacteria_45_10]
MTLDLSEKTLDELYELLAGKAVSVKDKLEEIDVQRAVVKDVGLPRYPTSYLNTGKVCILDTDVGEITVWDGSVVNLVD